MVGVRGVEAVCGRRGSFCPFLDWVRLAESDEIFECVDGEEAGCKVAEAMSDVEEIREGRARADASGKISRTTEPWRERAGPASGDERSGARIRSLLCLDASRGRGG